MKRRVKRVLKRFWKLTAPVRHPFTRRARSFIGGAVAASMSGIEYSINVARCTSDAHSADTNLVLDSLVRELARLQRQVEVLQESVDELRHARYEPELIREAG